MSKLIQKVQQYLLQPKPWKSKLNFSVTDGSIVVKDENGKERVIGKCLRRLHNEYNKVPPTDMRSPYDERVMQIGKAVEVAEVDNYKRMRILKGQDVKYNALLPGTPVLITGESEAVVLDEDTGKDVGVEIKTVYGRGVTEIKRKQRPKDDHLVQVCLYLWMNHLELKEYRLIYIGRDQPFDEEFTVTLSENGEVIVNEKWVTGVTVEGILNRFRHFLGFLERKEVPPKDFRLEYTDDEIEQLYKNKEVSKSAYEKWKGGKRIIGDWQCRSCNWRSDCWSDLSKKEETEGLEEI